MIENTEGVSVFDKHPLSAIFGILLLDKLWIESKQVFLSITRIINL